MYFYSSSGFGRTFSFLGFGEFLKGEKTGATSDAAPAGVYVLPILDHEYPRGDKAQGDLNDCPDRGA